ncbi:hypothetical protein SESBI_46839, partial [Sesbania bispinosa]
EDSQGNQKIDPIYGDWITVYRNKNKFKQKDRQPNQKGEKVKGEKAGDLHQNKFQILAPKDACTTHVGEHIDKGKGVQLVDHTDVGRSSKTWVRKRQRKESNSPVSGPSDFGKAKAHLAPLKALPSSKSLANMESNSSSQDQLSPTILSWADGTRTSWPLVRASANRFTFVNEIDNKEQSNDTKSAHIHKEPSPPTPKEPPDGEDEAHVDAIMHVDNDASHAKNSASVHVAKAAS